MENPRTFHVSFLALAAVGFFLLWPMMAYNGTLVALLRAAWTGTFADGRPLRSSYIGFPPIDFVFAVLVAFFDDQIDGRDRGTWLFMLNFQMVLQTVTLWILIEASRRRQSSVLSKNFFVWPLLTNLFGAAIIHPLYFYFHARSSNSHLRTPSPVTSTQLARSLLPVVALTGCLPVLVMLYGYSFTTDPDRQAITATCQFAPLLLIVAEYWVFPAVAAKETRRNEVGRVRDLVCHTYALGGFVGGVVYMITLTTGLTSTDPSVSLGRMFIPCYSSVVSGGVDNIHEGGLLFLQYDWIVVNLSCALWIYRLTGAKDIFPSVESPIQRLAAIFFSLFMFGPGATGSAALWAREQGLEELDERQRRLKENIDPTM